MTKRSYKQICATAYALDVIGERWTLLIIRELLPGPRRYSDMLQALRGIGTNLLAKRLKDLEQVGVIQQRALPPPANASVYELTPLGRSIEEAFVALSIWGMNFAPLSPPEEAVFPASSALMAIKTAFSPQAAGQLAIRCEFHADGDVFYACVEQQQIEVCYGAAHQPDVVAETTFETILSLLRQQLTAAAAIEREKMRVIEGDEDALLQFWEAIRLADLMPGLQ